MMKSFLTHKLIKLFLIAPVLALAFTVDVSTTQEACAAPTAADNGTPIYYDAPDECTRGLEPTYCPPNMTNISEGEDGTHHLCRNRGANLFCQMMTGSSVVASNDKEKKDRDYYCVGTPDPALGYCDPVADGYDIDSNDELARDHFRFFLISIPQPLKQALSVAETGTATVRSLSDYARYFKCKEYKPKVDGHELEEKKYLKVPTFYLGENDIPRDFRWSGNAARIDDDSTVYQNANINRFYMMAYWGFILKRDVDNHGRNIYFCNNPRDLLLFVPSGGSDVPQCYKLDVTGQADSCTLDITGLGDRCLVGRNAATLNDTVFHIGASNSNLSTQVRVEPSTSVLCQKNALNLFAEGSHKGCSSFYEIQQSNNQVIWRRDTPDDVIKNCYNCLYGTTTFDSSIPADRLVDRENLMSPVVTSASLMGERITPNNEPFLKPIQGRIYSELGCIGTNNPAEFVNTAMRFALGIMGILAILRIIQGALRIRAGDPESVAEGREIIVAVLIGLFVIIFSVAILNFIGLNVLNIGGFNPLGS